MGKPLSYFVWMIIELLSILLTLGGVAMIFLYMKGDDVSQNGVSMGGLLGNSGLLMFGLVTYHFSRRAKIKIKKSCE